MQDFLNVEDLNEEDLDAILGLSTGEEKAGQLQDQLAYAQSLRNQPGPEGRKYGRMYTAANPLEHVAHAWQGIKAGKDAERISTEQDALMQKQMEARKRFFELMMLRNQQPQQPQPQQEYGPESYGDVY
jgi:hypothetical protein